MAYLKNWTDNFFQIFFMGTSWVAVSINNITTRASSEMTSQKNIKIFDFNGVNVAKNRHVAGQGICHLLLPCLRVVCCCICLMYVFFKGGMLSIENVKPRDRGPYRCKVWNSIGQIKRDILLDVRCKYTYTVTKMTLKIFPVIYLFIYCIYLMWIPGA